MRVWYDDDTKQLRTDMYGGLDKTIATKVSPATHTAAATSTVVCIACTLKLGTSAHTPCTGYHLCLF